MQWMRLRGVAWLAALSVVMAATARAQGRLVTGQITDSTGNPIPLVHVFKSTRAGEPAGPEGALSDANGRYRLRVQAGDSLYIGIRRIGFTKQPARRVAFGERETVELNWVLGAVPQVLAAVHVTPGTCHAITQYPEAHPVREIWDGAVAAVRARQAFLETFRYEEHVVRQEMQEGKPSRVTLDSTNVVYRPTPPDPIAAGPLGSITTDPQRRRVTRLWAPTDRSLIDPVFVSRFCFEDGIVETSDKYTQLSFRETGGGRGAVIAKGTLRFRSDVPGLAAVLFTYEVNGKPIGRGSVTYSLIPVEGTTFPLEAVALLETLDPTGRAVTGRAATTFEYSKFERVVR